MKIQAEIVADSLSPQGDRLTSLLITFPRIILAEVNTHRMLSKNTSSSRAIPFNKMVEVVKENPFIPIAWQKHHSGMQGNVYWDVTIKGEPGELDHTNIPAKWLRARDTAVTMAEVLYDGPQGVTKQICNRLLEPFMWTTMLITGSKEGWDNFFELRCPKYFTPVSGEGFYAKSWKELKSWHSNPKNEEILENADTLFKLQHNKGQAEIHMMALAEEIYDAMNESTPKKLEAEEWHIPFENKINDGKLREYFYLVEHNAEPSYSKYQLTKVKISTSMSARTSYTVIGDEDFKSSKEWQKLYPEIKVLDPDGWDRQDFENSWNEKISFEEYQKRLSMSTCKGIQNFPLKPKYSIDYQRMIELHDKLVSQQPPHSSPMEHCARAMSDEEYYTFVKGNTPFIKQLETNPNLVGYIGSDKIYGWCRNFKGFIPYRYMIENEKKKS